MAEWFKAFNQQTRQFDISFDKLVWERIPFVELVETVKKREF